MTSQITPQPYPLYVTTFSPILKSSDQKRDPMSIAGLLAGWTYRVVGWTPLPDWYAPVVISDDGIHSPRGESISVAADFEGPCFFAEKKIAAISNAARFLYEHELPYNWNQIVSDATARIYGVRP